MGWGSNWPMLKLLLQEMPPLTVRGLAGVSAGLVFAAGALMFGVRLAVPAGMWPRLLLAAGLNVTAWMGMATFGLVWLGAGEAPGPTALSGGALVIGALLIDQWLALRERQAGAALAAAR